MTALIYIPAILFVLLLALLALSACMLSSQITQDEEQRTPQ